MLDTAEFKIVKRNVKGKPEYCLFVKLDHNDEVGWWGIVTWTRKPKDDDVQTSTDMFLRSCEVYHKHLKMPSFHLVQNSEVKWLVD